MILRRNGDGCVEYGMLFLINREPLGCTLCFVVVVEQRIFYFAEGVTMVIADVPEEHSIQNGDEQSSEG